MLEGLLVDLVPYGDAYFQREPDWINSEAWWWASVGDRPIVSRAAVERHQQENAERRQRNPALRVMFGIQTKPDAPEPCKPLGDFALNWVIPYQRLGVLGAAICEPGYLGGGYGTDALLLVADYAFDWLDLRKLALFTMGLNARVLRQMEKVGFVQEGCQRKAFFADGQWVDAIAFGLLREEWPGRAAMIEKLGLKARPKG